ncbi:hypothetical protein [Methylobacter sp.]|uniref:hypothetical protein n=1 Tax=Methylobacter sp. TaxID=2051955 RepID=UPI0011FD74DD|nr:hypothetical protein [Methylobacter sp.]TAK60988.1 MAG: hypothetical protein EPO18_15455 [Methylobacter sp.]
MLLNRIVIFLILSLVGYAAYAEPVCTEPELTKDQLIEIIRQERLHRSDLPKAYPQSNYVLNRQGCYYAVIESAVPERPGKNIVFKLNQKGIIVDVMRGR